jgi:uncharacterized protein Usg
MSFEKDRYKEFEDALSGSLLTTAEIMYHLPDHPLFLQTYLWQDFDSPPDFPKLFEFLKFWEKSLEGKLHSVRLMTGKTLTANEVKNILMFEG